MMTRVFVVLILASGCKPSPSSSSAPKGDRPASPPVSGTMCERAGGLTAADGACRCSNGVAAFKLLGQTCAQMLVRQTSDCTARNGQVLYDDEKCRCFPGYEPLNANENCRVAYEKVSQPKEEVPAEADPTGACGVIERATGKVQETCFENVDLDGCERSFQVAFQQLKPETYEMVFFPAKSCAEAKSLLVAAPAAVPINP